MAPKIPKIPIYRDYTSTVSDIKAELRSERKEELARNLDAMNKELTRLRERTDGLAVLAERVDWLVWMMRAVIIAGVVEIIAGLIVAYVMKGGAK